jgi:hypothetical protein
MSPSPNLLTTGGESTPLLASLGRALRARILGVRELARGSLRAAARCARGF